MKAKDAQSFAFVLAGFVGLWYNDWENRRFSGSPGKGAKRVARPGDNHGIIDSEAVRWRGDLNLQDLVSQWYEEKRNVEEMRRWNPALKAWERDVIGHFPSGARLLDIGCGLGREAFPLADAGYDVAGIDLSREVISQVRQLSAEKGYDIPFIAYDGKKLPFPDDSFDAVLIWAQTFGLLYGEDFKREYLAECRRVLKTGGLFSFSAHDYDYLKAQYPHCLDGRKFYPYAGSEIYWEAFEIPELTQYARQAGFEVVLCERGSIYKPEDGTILHCLCRKQQADRENIGGI